MAWDTNYRMLAAGEIVQEGDEVDASPDGWRDEPRREPAGRTVGTPAPDPSYPSHRRYRRKSDGSSANASSLPATRWAQDTHHTPELLREHAEYMESYSEPFIGSTDAIARALRWGADTAAERDRLREALAKLEAACERVCAGRSQEAYDAMISSGQEDDLDALDEARREARAALTDSRRA